MTITTRAREHGVTLKRQATDNRQPTTLITGGDHVELQGSLYAGISREDGVMTMNITEIRQVLNRREVGVTEITTHDPDEVIIKVGDHTIVIHQEGDRWLWFRSGQIRLSPMREQQAINGPSDVVSLVHQALQDQGLPIPRVAPQPSKLRSFNGRA